MFGFRFPYFFNNDRTVSEDVKGKLPSEDEILNKVKEFAGSKKRLDMIIGENYYVGNHDILRKKRTAIGEGGELEEVFNLPNNRVVDNQYKKLVDQKVNYIVGKPITFKSDSERYSKFVKEILNAKFSHSLKNAARDALNCGIGWVFVGYDDRGDISFKRIKPWELVPVWKDEEHTRLKYAIRFYDVKSINRHSFDMVRKVEVFDFFGIRRYVIEKGKLLRDGKNFKSPYFFRNFNEDNWGDIPIICFKYNENEMPLIKNVKSLQDGLNVLISNFQNAMEEDVRNTIIVLKNYDGENLGEFRKNLATFGAVKVRSVDGSQGGVDTLNIQVNCENYNAVIKLFKKAIIENGMGYDAKDDRLQGQPNMMNILSMYSDIDLDTNGIEMEFQNAFKNLLYFVDCYLEKIGKGNFFKNKKEVIFNRDILINEGEIIDNCIKSLNILSIESVVAKHPWVEDSEEEMRRISKEKES
ncbi:MAG: phage portal protein [Lachnospirales bacterium]